MLFAAHPRDMNHSLISTENNEDCSSGVRSQIKRRSEEKPDYFIYPSVGDGYRQKAE